MPRDASSDSAPRDRKRKRDKTDKKEKKEKDRGGDRRGDDRGDDRKARRRDVDEDRGDDRGRGSNRAGYGYGGSHGDDSERRHSKRSDGEQRGDRDRDRRRDRDGGEGRDRRGSDHRDDRRDRRGSGRDRDRKESDGESPQKPEKRTEQAAAAESPQLKAKDWRDEVDEDGGEDLRDLGSDDEEAEAKRLEESRKRRAALMAQAKPVESKPKEESNGNGANKPEDSEKKDEPEKAPAKEEEGGGDMFDLSANALETLKEVKPVAKNIGLTGASTDDWDDEEGYYQAQMGELLEDRYLIQETVAGKGVFSNVVKAKDTKAEGKPMVALKIIRSNDMMKKAAEKEIEILQTLNNNDKGNKRHIIRMTESFYYRKHIFLVFECMAEDLRGALKKFTKNKGMALQAVRAYTKQLLIGVRHMHKFNIIHADLKPDNILISADNNVVKLCDFGTAFETKDAGISPYLMSRFYRPAEVILGCEYGIAVDIWALACTLFEIFTGKTLLQGKTNNDMLKRIMDLKGKLPKNVIKKGHVWQQHFNENLDFKYIDKDSMTGEEITRVITDCGAKKELKEYILERVGKEKQQSQDREDQQYVKKSIHFSDLMDKMLALDPKGRLTAEDALKHHFLDEWKPGKSGAKK
eukprot:TRINITY_DN22104_c0_g1_i1.p1 TRINITY_DN22104_c0_g1~~TRINITY_DN22104_c0_g1_i1.p1  ORF type:complete len:635 (-),score=164.80 TRINITY_DN22104_c0_g1_i1:107-2011(-)